MIKVLLDTDIGNDIDDSACLAYLLRQNQCELLGVTTVTGQPVERAKLASAICVAAGRDDVPIYPGTETPLLTPQKQAVPHQAAKLHRWPHKTGFPACGAVEFLRGIIRENPGEITLLGIGPLTNVALLFALDAEIPALLKKLVVMCGVFEYKYKGGVCLTEWNARCDPYATAIVYNTPNIEIVSVGLDVTQKVTLEKDEIIKCFTSEVMRVVLDFSGVSDNTRDSITFHDPLAAAVIFDESICLFKRGGVSVEVSGSRLGERLEGLTYFTPDENGKNEVAFDVDGERFFNHYFSVVNG